MNKDKAVQFLAAEVLGWKWYENDRIFGMKEAYWIKPDGSSFDFLFDPFNDITHAWMILKQMRVQEQDIWWKFCGEIDKLLAATQKDYFGVLEAVLGKLDAEVICIAAVRALASKEQLVEFGQ